VVECTALEMRHTGNRIGGSNPSLSASPLKNLALCSFPAVLSGPQKRGMWGATPQNYDAGKSPKSILQTGFGRSACELARKGAEVRGAAKSITCGNVEEPRLESLSVGE
jgi:hypothetical protein